MTRTDAVAMLFPGIAPATHVSVGEFMASDSGARDLLARADAALGTDVLERFRTDPDDTEAAQVAFLVVCLGLAGWAEARLGVEPSVCVGPSFGQLAAAAYAGSVAYDDAVRLTAGIARRESAFGAGDGADTVTHFFFRTLGEQLDDVLGAMADAGHWTDRSAYLAQDFFAVSLHRDALEEFKDRLRAVRGVPLYTMHPPVHTTALRPLRDQLEDEVFGAFDFADPQLPIVSDVDGAVVRSGAQVREMLLDGFVNPVHWVAAARTLRRLEVGQVCVPGPSNLFDRLPRDDFDVLAVGPELALGQRQRTGTT